MIVYRASPGNKAEAVKLIKRASPNLMTLAIGDGSNDVNMIQTADLGIGIIGKEGGQAASFADFAIPHFSCLRRLLFWHGRSFGRKFSKFVPMYLWKTYPFSLMHIWLNLDALFSAVTFFSATYWSLYPVIGTNFGIFTFQIMDQDIPFSLVTMER